MSKLLRYFITLFAIVLAHPALSANNDYQMGTGDVLRITVYGQPDLATEARIGGSGSIAWR